MDGQGIAGCLVGFVIGIIINLIIERFIYPKVAGHVKAAPNNHKADEETRER